MRICLMMKILVVLGLLVVCCRADITGQNPAVGACLCLYFDSVNVRDGPCGNEIGSSNSGDCFKYTGSKETCSLSGTTYEFFATEYGASTGWIAGDFLNIGSDSQCSSEYPGTCAGVNIVSRAQWGARPPAWSIPPLPNPPVQYGFVHHTVTGHCYNQADCEVQMRNMQNYHMDTNGWPDIGYNFLVGEDGQAYEGRGWNTVGAHTINYNDIAVAVSVIGDYTNVVPNQAAQDAIRNILDCAVQQGYLIPNYDMYGHRDAWCTACPGDSLYPLIQTWPEYGPGGIPSGCQEV